MRIAVIGAGCSGSYFGYLAASAGFDVTLFDHSHPREKPCGGAVPARNFEKFAVLKEFDFPKRKVERIKVLMRKQEIKIELPEPIYVVDRKNFDGALLSKAIESGAKHIKEKVKDIAKKDNEWRINGEHCFDMLIGADGTNSQVRKKLLGAQESKQFGFSYYARLDGALDDEIALRFYPNLAGYGWIFPRPTGAVCGIYFIHSSQKGRAKKLFDELAKPLIGDSRGLSASLHPIPCIKRGRYSLTVSGDTWALIGDAAMLADPHIGEGIFNALSSSEILFDALKRGDLRSYQSQIYQTVAREVIASSKALNRLYSPVFLKLLMILSSRSATAKDFAGEFLSRKIGYQALNSMGLKPAFAMLKEALFKPNSALKRKREEKN